MSDTIKVHCPACRRSIRAPRAAAGRYGKCPSCQTKVYVPTPDDELEEIPLAPIDEEGERLRREAHELNAELLRMKGDVSKMDTGTDSAEPSPAAGRAEPEPVDDSAPPVPVADTVIAYLLALKKSDLDKADALVGTLKSVKAQAKSRIEQLRVDAMPPPQLGDIPPALYQGFLKKLDEALG